MLICLNSNNERKHMDYQKLYNSLVTSNCSGEYTEVHHKIPKCMGGTNSSDNLVRLSYRKHFLCHWLLCKIYPENVKLKAAFCKMLESTKNQQRVVTSKHFDYVKRVVKDVRYPWLQNWLEANGGPWNKGIKGAQVAWNKGLIVGPATEERKKKTSETLKERYKNIDHHRKGKSPWCAGTKGTGVVKAWNKGKISPKSKCMHCDKMVDAMNMSKWHGDKCKAA